MNICQTKERFTEANDANLLDLWVGAQGLQGFDDQRLASGFCVLREPGRKVPAEANAVFGFVGDGLGFGLAGQGSDSSQHLERDGILSNVVNTLKHHSGARDGLTPLNKSGTTT